MREIKFRVWDKEEKRMEFVGAIDWTLENEKIITCNTKTTKHYSYQENEKEMDSWVIMQSTGLFDRNGKEIYEGDILEDSRKQKGKVLWHYNSFLVEWQIRDSNGQLEVERMYDSCFGYGKIIGNIYETPELIK